MLRVRLLLLLVALAAVADAAPRRRAAGAFGSDAFRPYPLHSVELTADRSDLGRLRTIVGEASIVGMGDATHGTHEFYALRLRLIDYLVHEMGFDVLSIEAPFPITERINAYAQGGPGDPRALLRELKDRLLYLFWDVEELLAAIEWVRHYNLHRGDRPPIEIAGADIYDEAGGVAGVVAYLDRVDPAAAHEANRDYACVLRGERDSECEAAARRIHASLAARRAELEPLTGKRAFDDAERYATTVLQFFHAPVFAPREESMAANLLWIREHRGRARKVMHWGHQEHIGKIESPFTNGRTMGSIIAGQLGRDYVAIGTLGGSGTFLQWQRSGSIFIEALGTFADPAEGSYELQFRRHGHRAALIPLRGGSGTGTLRTAPTTVGQRALSQSLPRKLDAVIYVDVMTPTRPLR